MNARRRQIGVAMSASPKFAHVVFQTGQPNQMRDWYCAVLDGHVVYQDQALCFIAYDDEHHRVALITLPVESQRKHPTTACAHHVAYTFETSTSYSTATCCCATGRRSRRFASPTG